MATAIPLAVGLTAGGAAYMLGATTALAINIGMFAMTVAMMLLGPKKQEAKLSTADYAAKEYTARADASPVPRLYGTVRLPAQLVWFGNFYYRDTKKSEAESRVY